MAVQRNPQFEYNLAGIVDAAKNTFIRERKDVYVRRESELNRLIDQGISKAEQMQIRKKHLEAAEASGVRDQEYVEFLKDSVSSLENLVRREKFAEQYADAYNSWKIKKSASQTLASFLQQTIDSATDSVIRADAQERMRQLNVDIVDAEANALTNFITFAKEDKGEDIVKEGLVRLRGKMAESMAVNDEESTNLYRLYESQLNNVLADIKIDRFNQEVNIKKLRSSNPLETLSSYDDAISNSDDKKGFKYGGKAYASEKEFFTVARNSYLTTNFFTEFENYFKDVLGNKVDEDIVGAPVILADAKAEFSKLASRPEFAPFTDKLNASIQGVVGVAAEKFGKRIYAGAKQGEYDFNIANELVGRMDALVGQGASFELSSLKASIDNELARRGVKAEAQKAEKALKLPQSTDVQGGAGVKPEASTVIREEEKPTTQKPAQEPVKPPAPGEQPAVQEEKPVQFRNVTVEVGDSLSAIAARISKESGKPMTYQQIFDVNKDQLSDPNLIKPGQVLKVPAY